MKSNGNPNPPPQTLGQLRALVAQLRRGDAGFPLGNRTRHALEQMVAAPRRTAISSIIELADATGVNASTLTRLSRRLGFKGFNEFQDVFRNSLAGGARGVERAETGSSSGAEVIARVSAQQAANIAATAENLRQCDVDRVAARLVEARHVTVFGTRQMHAAARTLYYGLGMLRSDVDMLGGSDHGVAHALAQLGPRDLLVVLSSAPHTRATLELARIVAARGVGVIAVSDTHDCPLSLEAEDTIVCETLNDYFGASAVAVVAVIETLLSVAAQRLGAGSLREVERREKLISELEVAVVGS